LNLYAHILVPCNIISSIKKLQNSLDKAIT
jgi:hypothetical protein